MTRKIEKDQFELYDLIVQVESINGNCTCQMSVGDRFELSGGKLSMPEGQSFCLYALQSCIPLLPAKQRRSSEADWMETDVHVTCPDPACGLIMRIERKHLRTWNHDDVSAIPMK